VSDDDADLVRALADVRAEVAMGLSHISNGVSHLTRMTTQRLERQDGRIAELVLRLEAIERLAGIRIKNMVVTPIAKELNP
jgi:hypothetical protein